MEQQTSKYQPQHGHTANGENSQTDISSPASSPGDLLKQAKVCVITCPLARLCLRKNERENLVW